jgi:stage II sporulation protein D
MRTIRLPLFLTALALSALAGAPGYAPPEVRIKLMTLDRPVTVTGERLTFRGEDGSGGGEALTLSPEAGAIKVNGQRVSLPLALAGERLAVDGVAYRGRLEITDCQPPLLLNLLDVESYVAGVINQEMDSRWPKAAVDAQAILARTYALKRREERRNQPFDLDRTVTDQVYNGMAGEDALAWAAVERTRGQALFFQGKLASAFYHSCCGGHTELPSAVWGGDDSPYQVSVACSYCQRAPRFFWRYPVDKPIGGAELAGLLRLAGEVSDLQIRERTATGRAAFIEAVSADRSQVFSGQDFRRLLGYDHVWSTAFELERTDAGYIFRGSGSGHGVGLCQWGARGMAEAGKTAEAILKFYFPGTVLQVFAE